MFSLLLLAVSAAAQAKGPHPVLTGVMAAADDPSVASTNPAGLTRFDERDMRFDVYGFFPDNTWEGQLGNGATFQLSEIYVNKNQVSQSDVDYEDIWAFSVGYNWPLTDRRTVTANLNYMKLDDAPITSPPLGLLGTVTGEYVDRETIWLNAGLSFGTGP